MKRWVMTVLAAMLLLMAAGAALAAEGEYYVGQAFPSDEALRATFDTKDLKYVQGMGYYREADDKYSLWYLSRYQDRAPVLASLTIYKLSSNMWVYQFGQSSFMVRQAAK